MLNNSVLQIQIGLIAFVIGCLVDFIWQYQENKKIGKEGIELDELICIGGILGIVIALCIYMILFLFFYSGTLS